jgi:hypothetical protein
VVEETKEGDNELEAKILPEGVSGHLERIELWKFKLGILVVLSRTEADVFFEPALSALLRSGVVDHLHSLIGLSHPPNSRVLHHNTQ